MKNYREIIGLSANEDAYGNNIADTFYGKGGGYDIIEREDGHFTLNGDSDAYTESFETWSRIQKEASKLIRGRVLDIGCGGGILAESMSNLGAETLGIDLSDKALKVAELHALETGASVRYRSISAESLALEQAAQFDIVTCMEMLEHVPNPASVVQACADLAKPGATLFFSTLNRNLKSYVFAIVGAEYILRLLPKGTHQYAKFIKPSELARYIRQANLEVIGMKGLTYNPVTQVYRLSDDTDVNYMIAVRKPLE